MNYFGEFIQHKYTNLYVEINDVYTDNLTHTQKQFQKNFH